MTQTSTLPDLFSDLYINALVLAAKTNGKDERQDELFAENGVANFFLNEKDEILKRLPKEGLLNQSIRKDLDGLCQLLKDVKENEALAYASDYLTVNICLNQHAHSLRGF